MQTADQVSGTNDAACVYLKYKEFESMGGMAAAGGSHPAYGPQAYSPLTGTVVPHQEASPRASMKSVRRFRLSPAFRAAAALFTVLCAGSGLLFLPVVAGWAAPVSGTPWSLFLLLSGFYGILALVVYFAGTAKLGVLDRAGAFEDALDSLRDMVFLFHRETLAVRYANRAAVDVAGLDPQQLDRVEMHALLPAFSADQLAATLRPLADDPGYTLQFETPFRVGDTRFNVEMQMQCRPMGDGAPLAIAVLRDLRRQEQEMGRLHEAEERFRSAFATSPDAISISTMEGTLVEVNPKFCELSGYSVDELLGKSTIELGLWKNPDHDRRRLLEQLRRQDLVSSMEADFVRKDGAVVQGMIAASIVRLGMVPHLLLSVRDVTGIRQMEAERVQLEKRLGQARNLEAMATLAGGMAHEFNNILTSIIGYAELVRDEVARDSQMNSDLGRLLAKAGQAEDLIRQFLIYSRRQSGEKQPLDVTVLIKEVVRAVQEAVPESLQVEPRIVPGCGTVLADPVTLHQALMHIVNNAVEAMHGEGRLIVGIQPLHTHLGDELQFPELEPGPYIHLYIKDMGEGMDSATLSRIFDPFFTTKGVGTGTGMGMAVVHGIVADHGGKIRVNSRKGYGSTVHVVFPLQHRDLEVDTLLEGGGERVLVVTREATLAGLIRRFLEPLGYQVVTREDGATALRFLGAREEADVLLLDHLLPDMAAPELIEAVRAVCPSLPAIILGRPQTDGEPEWSGRIPAEWTLDKPLKRREMARMVRAVLDGPSAVGQQQREAADER